MLRELDPETGFTSPKSKGFVPTKAERAKFSEDGLVRIGHQLEDDKKWRRGRIMENLKERLFDRMLAKMAGDELKELGLGEGETL